MSFLSSQPRYNATGRGESLDMTRSISVMYIRKHNKRNVVNRTTGMSSFFTTFLQTHSSSSKNSDLRDSSQIGHEITWQVVQRQTALSTAPHVWHGQLSSCQG